ncbi:MAG TPA: inorganic phosphate transporter [Thermohalobaculum sp.]|nr:inorganic phosphate transporter [Thermohalobaculum sp.]
MTKTSLDKDLKKVVRFEVATHDLSRSLAPMGLGLLFLVAVLAFTTATATDTPLSLYVIAAGVIGGYMALNIGANDVANNMGPAVGGKALSMVGALVIAAICEAAGAILAGGDVVSTISKGIVTPDPAMQVEDFVLVMMAALLAAAAWINLATILNAPVSTTHSVVGGVLGAGMAASGPDIVSWPTMSAIAASWVISPVLGGIIAALFLGFIKWAVLYREDRITAAKRWVPVLIGVMAGVFAAYLVTKGLKRVWKPSSEILLLTVVAGFALGWVGSQRWVATRAALIENRRKQVSTLFVLPLIFAAALLSFAHGANDVANAVGPLAAIVAAAETGMAAPAKVNLPLWVLMVGAAGIAAGLALFGPRLIRTVGEKITRMDAIRAYCVALSAAITVIFASGLGLPVSSTHIAVGGIFGVGFLREALVNRGIHRKGSKKAAKAMPEAVAAAAEPTGEKLVKREQKNERRRLVRRRHIWSIGAAWVITVPAAGLLAALLFLVLRLFAGS